MATPNLAPAPSTGKLRPVIVTAVAAGLPRWPWTRIIGVLRFVAGCMLLFVGIFGTVITATLLWLIFMPGFPSRPFYVIGALPTGFALVGLIGGWLLWPGLRAFIAPQQHRSGGKKIAAWVATGASGTATAALVIVVVIVLFVSTQPIRQCWRGIFPASINNCVDWHSECRALGWCGDFRWYWQSRAWALFEQPDSLFAEFQRAMRDKHVRAGWVDIDNAEHVKAVREDWQRALVGYSSRGLLLDPDNLASPKRFQPTRYRRRSTNSGRARPIRSKSPGPASRLPGRGTGAQHGAVSALPPTFVPQGFTC